MKLSVNDVVILKHQNAFGSSEFWGNPSNYFRNKNESMWCKPFALKHQDIGGTFNFARMSLCKM